MDKEVEDGLVSVIMPSYNTAKYIVDAIESVLAQTYAKWELVIIDDCSTDGTENVVKRYSDSRIKYIRNSKNVGAAISRNKAIAIARGEWIAFLDSDDIWMPEKLEKQLSFMGENCYIFSYHEYEKIDESNKPLNIYVSGPEKITKEIMYRYMYPGCLTFMYNAKKIGLIQIKDIKKNNDYAILLQLCKKADCYLLKEKLAKYRIRRSSISHDKLYRKIRSHYELFRICDEQGVGYSFFCACRNMYYGLLKKMKFEIRTNGDE